jgi:hypothetical protein
MRGLTIFCGLVLTLSGGGAIAESTAASTTTPAAAYSSAGSTMGTLLGNPATKAVLEKALPEFIARISENRERVASMTLKELQETLKAYSPNTLPDAKLAEIDVELAKIPVSN